MLKSIFLRDDVHCKLTQLHLVHFLLHEIQQ